MEPDSDFKYIVRIADSNIDGNRTLEYGLTGIKGIGIRVAKIISEKTGIPKNEKMGNLSDEKIEFVSVVYALHFSPAREMIVFDFHQYDAEIDRMMTDLMLRASGAGLIRKGKEEDAASYVSGIINHYVMHRLHVTDHFPPGLAGKLVTDVLNGLRP